MRPLWLKRRLGLLVTAQRGQGLHGAVWRLRDNHQTPTTEDVWGGAYNEDESEVMNMLSVH